MQPVKNCKPSSIGTSSRFNDQVVEDVTTMRCDAVIRELAVPTDERDSTALAEHVAKCPACAAWAKRSAGLDRLWEATRPPEPSAEVWDVLWSRLARSLDASMPDAGGS